MELLHATGVEKGFGDRLILRHADLTVRPGERVGLVGVNGSGKSTLLRICGGADSADHGEVVRHGRMAMLDQEPQLPGRTVGEAADEAVAWHRRLLADYEAATHGGDLHLAEELHARLDRVGWDLAHRVDAMLTRVGAPPREAEVARLSGGERRRVALARVLLDAPDLLLLDEPTNHLDADTVDWLQGLLASWRGAVVLVTHDRYLLEAVATRIVEVEDGETVSYDGSYADYLISRAERRVSLERADEARLALIAREAEWASRCPAAQTTKQKARLNRLAELTTQRGIRRDPPIELDLRSGVKLGATVLELRRVRKAFGDRTLVRDLELVLQPGDRLGILGPNGAGKSTLLKLLTGVLPPDKGEVVRGSRVKLAVLDQERTGLDPRATVYEAAGGGNDQVRVGDHWVHVASFLGRFHFSRATFEQRVAALSGGERARLLLARLLLQGANVLVLDEPTNDLDLTTLNVLEEALLSYDGVLVVVTHDRAMLDRVCNAVLAPERDGRWVRYASRAQIPAVVDEAPAAAAPVVEAPRPARVRRTFKEQKELEELPRRIEALEAEQEALGTRLADPAAYRDAGGRDASRRLAAIPAELEALYERWAELEAKG